MIALSEKKKKSMIEKMVEKHKAPVICPGCDEAIREDDDLETIEYIKTKRGTEIFLHRGCLEKVWNRKGAKLMNKNKTTKELRND